MQLHTDRILFGGDYNPEQWPEEVWEEDMRLFHLAHISEVTLNVFSWALLQPSEDTYDFQQLDRIMELARREHLKVILATSTAAQPAWMSARYPQTNRTDAHEQQHHFGGRQNICPTSPIFRHFAGRLVEKLAARYAGFDNLVAYHLSNEYGGYCYCEHCQAAYRDWLRRRYGTIENLNRAWNTTFWGHRFYDFSEIRIPDYLTEEFDYGTPGALRTNVQANSIDYRRFMTDCTIDLVEMEKTAIRKYSDLPITTNLMYNFDGYDLAKIARHLDFVSWDSYPAYGDAASNTALWHDLMRGIGGGQSFSLMEQTPSVTNWHPYCRLKRPGIMRLGSYQAVAHGADTVLFFQLRRSRGACEKYHGALIDHVGNEHTRVFQEMTELGAELEKLGGTLLAAKSRARAAILFDWDSWWGTALSAGPSVLISYLEEIQTWYRALWQLHIPVDLLPVDAVLGNPDREVSAIRDPQAENPEGAAALAAYDLVFAPMLYLDKNGFSDALHRYVAQGGHFVTSYFSGYADDTDLVRLGGYPASWKDLLGVWVEESDALPPDVENHFSYDGVRHACHILCDLMHPLDDTVEILGAYEEDFYRNMPVVTRHPFGKGACWYVGTRSDEAFYQAFVSDVCRECGISPLAKAPAEVEITRRENENGMFLFLLNHSNVPQELFLPVGGTDLLTGTSYRKGETLHLAPAQVVILSQQDR